MFWSSPKKISGSWMWSDTGETLTYKNWAPGQPDIAQYHDCVWLTGWYDDLCTKSTVALPTV